MRRPPVALVAVAVAAAVASPAGAALCRTRKGVVFERAACRPRETAVDLAAAGIALPGEPGVRGTSHPRLRAVDAGGRTIGFVNPRGEILVLHAGRGLYVPARADGFAPQFQFFFDAPGCAGTRHVLSNDAIVERAPVANGAAMYPGDPVVMHAFQSTAFTTSALQCSGVYDAATGVCCQPTTFTGRAGPAAAIDLSGFTPPFRVEVER